MDRVREVAQDPTEDYSWKLGVPEAGDSAAMAPARMKAALAYAGEDIAEVPLEEIFGDRHRPFQAR